MLSEYEEKANHLILQSSYAEAAKYLEKIVAYEPQNTTLLYQLAEAYRLARNGDQAAKYYGRVLKFSDDSAYLNYPLILFHYGRCLMQGRNYSEAEMIFSQFQRNYKGSKETYYKNWAEILANSCSWAINESHTRVDVDIHLLDKTVNSGKTEFSPVLIQEDVLLFSSLRPDLTQSAGSSMRASIYTSQYSGEKWLKAVPFPGPFRYLDDHVGHGSFSPDKERFYFTICPSNTNNDPLCSIYYVQVEGNSWSDPSFVSAINIAGYESTTPFVTIDNLGTERIYFASDRPDGEGGKDIWYVIRDVAGNFTSAKNLGPSVNTPFNEVSPFVNLASNTLFFSSDGQIGYGGFDVYRIPFDGESFGLAMNMGKPFNSSFDDIYFTQNPDGEGGFIVSNRENISKGNSKACCDNIFRFSKVNTSAINEEIVVHARVFGKEGQQTFELDDVLVQWFEISDNGVKVWLEEIFAFDNKPFEFSADKRNQYEITLEKNGYEKGAFVFDQTLLNAADSILFKDFFLNAKGVLVRGVVYGEDGKRMILLHDAEMKIYRLSYQSEAPKLVKTIALNSEGFRTTVSPGADYRIVFTRPGFLVGSLYINADQLEDPVIPEFNVSLLQKQVGVSTIIPGIAFESGKINLDNSSIKQVEKLAFFLSDNPKVDIEIGAFTDDSGSASVNRNLSEKRANAVIAYLMGKGIAPERLVAKGYGELNPVAPNNSDENRQKNRRIEMKILKIGK